MVPWEMGRGVVEFPDGRRIRGRGLLRAAPEGPAPQYGAYLYIRDPGPYRWPYTWVRWPDFGLPRDTGEAMAALRDLYERAATERVEVACRTGVERTGTAMAAFAVIAGIAQPSDATVWAREQYHDRAAEMPWQHQWILGLDAA